MKSFQSYVVGAIVCAAVLGADSYAGPMVDSYHEMLPLYSVQGATPSVSSKESQMSFSLLPYYAHAAHAKDPKHNKVPVGDRLGRVNMLGLFVGDSASPYEKKYGDSTLDTVDKRKAVSYLHYVYGQLAEKAAIAGAGGVEARGYLGSGTDTVDDFWGQYRTIVRYERYGLRGSLNYSFSSGLGVAVYAGIAEYSVQPSYLPNPKQTSTGAWVNQAVAAVPSDTRKIIQDEIVAPEPQALIGKTLGIDFSGVMDTTVEDTCVEIFWRRAYQMKDADGEHVVTTSPHFSLGLTLPTAQKKRVEKMFDMAMGSDGFYGVTAAAEVNFDFPGMMEVGGGVRVTLFNEDDIGRRFVPSHLNQQGIYPWKASVIRRPGPRWLAFMGMKARNFVDYLSFYCDYIWVTHERDSITISSADTTKGFLSDKLSRDGQYTGQALHLGLEYAVTPELRFGFALQSTFAGMRVLNTLTLAASMTFVF